MISFFNCLPYEKTDEFYLTLKIYDSVKRICEIKDLSDLLAYKKYDLKCADIDRYYRLSASFLSGDACSFPLAAIVSYYNRGILYVRHQICPDLNRIKTQFVNLQQIYII